MNENKRKKNALNECTGFMITSNFILEIFNITKKMCITDDENVTCMGIYLFYSSLFLMVI